MLTRGLLTLSPASRARIVAGLDSRVALAALRSPGAKLCRQLRRLVDADIHLGEVLSWRYYAAEAYQLNYPLVLAFRAKFTVHFVFEDI